MSREKLPVKAPYMRVLNHDEIQPAAAASSSGADTPLPALLLQLGANLTKIFCREGALWHWLEVVCIVK